MRLNNTCAKFAFLMAMLFCIQVSAQSINFNIGLNGLTSLTYGSSQLVTSASNGMFRPTSVSFKKADGTPVSTIIGSSYTVDLVNKIVTHTTANKFTIQCHYAKVSDTRLDFKFVVKNLSSDIFTGVSGQFVILSGDSIPQYIPTSVWRREGKYGNPSGGSDIPLIYGQDDGPPNMAFYKLGNFCNVAVCKMSDPALSHSWDGIPPNASSNQLTFTFSLSQNVSPNSYSDTCIISFRFDAPGKLDTRKFNTLCADAIMLYGGAFPSIANYWPDRRPIGREMISEPIDRTGASPTTANNPNRWFANDQSIDIRDTAIGLENFRSRMLGRADACITVLRKMNAQGFINWSIEGFGYLEGAVQLDPPTQTRNYPESDYPGDPHMAITLSPELGYKSPNSKNGLCIVDEYFKKFIDAGFIPGVTIDPQKIIKVGNAWAIVEADDVGQEIYEDVKYARERWGCRLFYVDANVTDVYRDFSLHKTIPTKDLLSKALAAFDDILIIPEWQEFNSYRMSSVYDDVYNYCKDGINATPEGVRMVYPSAFSMIAIGPSNCGPLPVTPYISGARKGDIYMTNCWYDNPGRPINLVDSINKINNLCGVRPYNVKITSPSTNGATVGKTFTITATASDSGANAGIDSIEFLSSGVKLGVAKTAPYTFTWTNAVPGKHSLYARAIDKTKNQACSKPVNVVVDPTVPPQSIKAFIINNSVKGPISVSVYSLNGRLIRQLDSKDPARLLTPVALRGLSSGIYIMKIKHANGAIDKRKMELVW